MTHKSTVTLVTPYLEKRTLLMYDIDAFQLCNILEFTHSKQFSFHNCLLFTVLCVYHGWKFKMMKRAIYNYRVAKSITTLHWQ